MEDVSLYLSVFLWIPKCMYQNICVYVLVILDQNNLLNETLKKYHLTITIKHDKYNGIYFSNLDPVSSAVVLDELG